MEPDGDAQAALDALAASYGLDDRAAGAAGGAARRAGARRAGADGGAQPAAGGRRAPRRLAGSARARARSARAATIADVGSGAGFPGPGARGGARRRDVRLLESQAAQVRVPEARLGGVGVQNARVVCARAEDWRDGQRRARRRGRARRGAAAGGARVRGAAAAPREATLVDWRGRRDARTRSRLPCGQPRSSDWSGRRSAPWPPVRGGQGPPSARVREGERHARALPATRRDGPQAATGLRRLNRARAERAARPSAIGASLQVRGHGVRDRQPEGRGGQDHHGGQRRRVHRGGRLRDPAGGRRSAGQRDGRTGDPAHAVAGSLRGAGGRGHGGAGADRLIGPRPAGAARRSRVWRAPTSSFRASRAPSSGCASASRR